MGARSAPRGNFPGGGVATRKRGVFCSAHGKWSNPPSLWGLWNPALWVPGGVAKQQVVFPYALYCAVRVRLLPAHAVNTHRVTGAPAHSPGVSQCLVPPHHYVITKHTAQQIFPPCGTPALPPLASVACRSSASKTNAAPPPPRGAGATGSNSAAAREKRQWTRTGCGLHDKIQRAGRGRDAGVAVSPSSIFFARPPSVSPAKGIGEAAARARDKPCGVVCWSPMVATQSDRPFM
eukprot:gene5581-biopygen1184